ncbi:shikimate dehydrogenase family protein [Galbibacter mesophilus]|uniref:shikimate dehydrogenase family protein n=1 Tax=Galbibacter mesophilus TaxID=379069 RepID=UPI00191E93E4|nr:shikimate dehydrogenase [Galbibacter mesophilus]MCM5664154.1 shikimate dehydrogenase [Galbibacter mesophilus]
MNKLFGLLGKNISYSFSKGYFTEKFKELGISDTHTYVNFDLKEVSEIEKVLAEKPNTVGFNVTIPYKEAIIPYLSDIDKKAKEIGAVNVVKVTEDGLKGYNTDVDGFENSIKPHLKSSHKNALILGTGGASKAVKYALENMGMQCTYVSRTASEGKISYESLSKEVMEKNLVIVNCTPLGTHPNIELRPAIPYEFITDEHLVFDLIYNPSQTTFMKLAEENGAFALNGHEMLKLQAEKAWEIWND